MVDYNFIPGDVDKGVGYEQKTCRLDFHLIYVSASKAMFWETASPAEDCMTNCYAGVSGEV